MTLNHTIPTEFGTNNTYWCVSRININTDDSEVIVVVSGWLDKASCLVGRAPQTVRQLEFRPGTTFLAALEGQTIQQVAYEAVKTHPAFVGATDDV